MVLQAYIDDSYDLDGTFCLAGHIASAESWVQFAKEWEEFLPKFGRLNKDDKYHFKMKEMAREGRIEDVPPFYRVIETHVLCSVSCAFKIADLEGAKNRIYIPGLYIDYGFLDNYYMFAFRALMDMFHNNRAMLGPVLPEGEKIDFIFDNQTEKKQILSIWEDYIAERPDKIRDKYGATPRFEDDMDFLPLQGADLWAWWVRKWAEEGKSEKMENCDFGVWKANRSNHVKLHISFAEDEIVEFIIGYLMEHLPPERAIYDRKHPDFVVHGLSKFF